MAEVRGGRLSNADETILTALASGRTVVLAAADAGVSEATIYRRLRNPQFRARLTELRAVRIRAFAETCGAEIEPSIRKLAEIRDTSTSEANQMHAAERLIEIALRLHHEAEILPRVAALEAAMNRDDGGDDDHSPEA